MSAQHPIKPVYTNSDVTALGIFSDTDYIGIAHGGTDATTAAGARTNLLELNPAPSADTWDGITISLKAHENLTLGSVCYINTDAEAVKTDADSASSMPVVCMATATINADATGLFLLQGVIHLHTLAPSLTVGSLVYASGSAGGITKDRPSASGQQVQILGVALASDIMYFNPSPVVVQIT